MMTTCKTCGKKFYRSENHEYHKDICFKCALSALTADDDFDQEPDNLDLENAEWQSGEILPGNGWETPDEEDRRLFPGDFLIEEDEWCYLCHSYQCECALRAEEDAERDRENLLDYLAWLYDEALEEDTEREETKRRAEEQARIDAEIAAEEEAEREEQEFWDSFSHFWYKLVGWKHYNRFVAPILIRIHRYKQDWRR